MAFVGEATFHEYERGNMGREHSILEPNPYVDVDVDDVIGLCPNWWKGNVDHESAIWSKDLVGYVSPIHVVEWDMSLF